MALLRDAAAITDHVNGLVRKGPVTGPNGRRCGKSGRVVLAKMPLADICKIINTAGEYWWCCLRAVARKRAVLDRFAAEVAKMPPDTTGLETVIYCVPQLVFYARPHASLSTAALIGRLSLVAENVWD